MNNPGGFFRALLMTSFMEGSGANVRRNNIAPPTDSKEGLAGNAAVTRELQKYERIEQSEKKDLGFRMVDLGLFRGILWNMATKRKEVHKGLLIVKLQKDPYQQIRSQAKMERDLHGWLRTD